MLPFPAILSSEYLPDSHAALCRGSAIKYCSYLRVKSKQDNSFTSSVRHRLDLSTHGIYYTKHDTYSWDKDMKAYSHIDGDSYVFHCF